MKILQTPISDNHKSAMFFNGIIATAKGYCLETFQTGELVFMGNEHVGAEIRELGQKSLINDDDIDNEDTIDILVDKFFIISKDGKPVYADVLVFDDYDDAITNFKEFIENI